MQEAKVQSSNTTQYAQLKVAIRPELAAAFKLACIASDISMSGVIKGLLEAYCHSNNPDKGYAPNLATRRQRRAAVRSIIDQLKRIKDNEESYKEKIPANLQGSEAFFTAENCISLLEEAIEALAEAY